MVTKAIFHDAAVVLW